MENTVNILTESCNHYLIKLRELTDDITTLRREIEEARQIVELDWQGESGTASLDVINRLDERFRGINSSLSEAMTMISGLIVEVNDNK